MTKRMHIQRSFQSGEISPKMLMRANTEEYKSAVLLMQNFWPTNQGSAQRTPGSRYVLELTDPETRIIPYLTSANERALVILGDEDVKMLVNINDFVAGDLSEVDLSGGGGTILFRRNTVKNFNFNEKTNWIFDPPQYDGANGEGPLGGFYIEANNVARLVPRLYKFPTREDAVVDMTGTAAVLVATSVATLRYEAQYFSNPAEGFGGYTLTFTVSANADFSSPLFERSYAHAQFPQTGSVFTVEENISLPTTGWTGTLYIRVRAEAQTLEGEREYSNPQFNIRYIQLFVNGSAELGEVDLTTPYEAVDLEDVQYVQSPYANKEIVFTHPKHAPQQLFFATGSGAYTFSSITFSNTPAEWEENNYPAACTSFNGRLVLAGSQSFRVLSGDPLASESETVWTTKVGQWNAFSDPSADPPEVDPDDSVQFTAIYRSPIQWVYGHKSLLVGALEYEYIADGQVIFSPGDVGVNLHSTNGGINVQPVGFGEAVLFAADGGRRLREMKFNDDDGGWVAPDMSLLNPDIIESGIKRMVRVRSPHQMCWCLTNAGYIAIFHSEGNIMGWSRYLLTGGRVLDLTALADDDGNDIVYMVVERTIKDAENEGDFLKKYYLEAVPGLSDKSSWDYMESTLKFSFDTATTTITGLESLEGLIVQATGNLGYIGFFRVTGGEIELPYAVISCKVGIAHRSIMDTLPPEKNNPGAKARYSEFSVRTLESTRPIINDERPADRDPSSPVGASNVLDEYKDLSVNTDEWSPTQVVRIEERVPLACEIIGFYAELKENSV